MRELNIHPKPITESGKTNASKVKKLVRNYPEVMRGIFDNFTDDTVDFVPEDRGSGLSLSRFYFEFGEEVIGLQITDTWTVDLTATTINLATQIGGIVDGIARESGRTYLAWAFLDDNLEFAGIGVTRKPHSSFTGVASGTKGSTATFTVTNGFQFVIGARVLARNTVGSAPNFEYNWGTVQTVANTSITVLLDNNTEYGTNITGVTSGVILQWDRFRPFVVTTTSQTLFEPYYSLIGEIRNHSTGVITAAYRRDDEWREQESFSDVVGGTSNITKQVFTAARYIPLWAIEMTFVAFLTGPEGALLQLYGAEDIFWSAPRITNAAVAAWENSRTSLLRNARFQLEASGNPTRVEIYPHAYRIPYGMRG